ncbi:unnamed protein product [Linum trigynum]|uniref:Uncharacterized protein n=1 Tax=Linum trigynum TaxID=586398 RepID=A0AAV2DK44_9ROSI
MEFPEFQFSAEGSEGRKKIDFNFSDEHIPCDLRNSLAWDTAFFTSPGIMDIDELFETFNLRAAMDRSKDKKPSSVATAAAASHYDSRQSLAWDSAFFTSAGVLDAEELSMVNKGFRNSVAKSEPETWRSIESSSTANSEGSSLASLELDLFSDIKGAVGQFHNGGSLSAKRKGMQEGNGGSSSGKPPRRMSSRGVNSTLSSKRASSMGSHGVCKGKMNAVKSTTPLRSPSSVLPATTRNGSSEQVMRTPPGKSSRKTVEPRMAASVPTLRTPLKFLAGSKNGSLSSSSSFLSTLKASPASSISGLSSSTEQSLRSTNQRHHVSPVKPCFASSSPRRSSTAPRTMKRFTGVGATPKNMQASGLRMPSPKLGYFDSENPSGSAIRAGNLKSNSHGQNKSAMATSSSRSGSRTSLGKHHLSEIVALSLNSKIGSSNERWQESFINNDNMKKKRCLKEDGEDSKVDPGARQGKGSSCSRNKRPGSNKENSIAASLDSQVDGLSRQLKAIHFNRGFSPVWK